MYGHVYIIHCDGCIQRGGGGVYAHILTVIYYRCVDIHSDGYIQEGVYTHILTVMWILWTYSSISSYHIASHTPKGSENKTDIYRGGGGGGGSMPTY